MPHDTALGAITLPDASDAADVPTTLTDLVADVEPKLIIPLTAAARAALVSPPTGLIVFETDTLNLVQYLGATLGWKLPWNIPWGPQVVTEDHTTPGSFVSDADALSTSFAFIADRRYKIHAKFSVETGNGTGAVYGGLSLDATFCTGPDSIDVSITGQKRPFSPFYIYEPGSSGSHTFTARLGAFSGGTARLNATSTNHAFLVIEDMGPA